MKLSPSIKYHKSFSYRPKLHVNIIRSTLRCSLEFSIVEEACLFGIGIRKTEMLLNQQNGNLRE